MAKEDLIVKTNDEIAKVLAMHTIGYITAVLGEKPTMRHCKDIYELTLASIEGKHQQSPEENSFLEDLKEEYDKMMSSEGQFKFSVQDLNDTKKHIGL